MSDPQGPVLVIGDRAGQLASALMAGADGLPVQLLGRPDLDFDRPETIRPVLHGAAAPSLMVNATAYTAVDRAETEADAALRANRDGPAALAAWCAEAGIPLIHVSTDYVFDGLKGAPYVETDPTNPTGVYGASKLAGEQAVLAACPRAIILRTSWVYAASGRNFVLTMLNARARTDRLRVVADRLLGDRQLMDDALQEVAIKTLRGLPSYRGEAPLGGAQIRDASAQAPEPTEIVKIAAQPGL